MILERIKNAIAAFMAGKPEAVCYIGGSDVLPPPLTREEEAQALRELDRVCRPGRRDFFASFRPSAAAVCCGMYRKRRAVP